MIQDIIFVKQIIIDVCMNVLMHMSHDLYQTAS